MSELNSKKGGLSFKPGGEDKYKILKFSGKYEEEDGFFGRQPIYEPTKGEYWVLRLDKDDHARPAMQAYLDSIRSVNPELAADLIERYPWLA